MLLIADNLLWI